MSRMIILYLGSLTLRSLAIAALVRLSLFRSRTVQLRHAALTLTLCSMLLMPIADALLPAAMVPVAVPEIISIQTLAAFTPKAPVQQPPSITQTPFRAATDWWALFMFLIVIVAFALLSRLVLVYRQIRRLRKESRPVSSRIWDEAFPQSVFRSVSIHESSSITVPITVGFLRPFLIFPSDWRNWDDWTLRAVLTHELTHVRRWDWAIGVLAAFAKCVFWFNPLAWWLERKLSTLAEQASDEACVRSSGDARRYAETLLQFAVVAKHGHRWIGGVAMAQHKITLRIERILLLGQPGSGILSRWAWAALIVLSLPVLYVSASAHSGQAPVRAVPSIEMLKRLPQIPEPLETALFVPQQPPPAPVKQETAAPQPPVAQEVPAVPPAQTPNPPAIANPDLVGEIRLILAPVTPAGGGQVEIQTRAGTTRYSGTAMWDVRNGALSSWSSNTVWTSNANAFVFAMTGVDGRKLLFENSSGGTYSYGCADCSLLVWESGVGSPSATPEPGMVFHLSTDGRSFTATCRAVECQIATNAGTGGLITSVLVTILREAEIKQFGVAQGLSPNSNRVCFSVFGNVKADGTPFTNADCPGGTALLPPTTLFFSVTR